MFMVYSIKWNKLIKNYAYHNPLCIYSKKLSGVLNFILQPHIFSSLFEWRVYFVLEKWENEVIFTIQWNISSVSY